MTRIGTLGANTSFITRMFDIQTRMNDAQAQSVSGLKSPSYAGIHRETNILLTFEAQVAASNTYIDSNKVVETKLSAVMASMTGIESSIKNFKNALTSFNQGDTTTRSSVEQIQTFAWETMLDLHSYLSESVNGQYLFSGGKLSREPMELPATTKDGFQAIYDGSNRTWATTRSAQLLETTLTKEASTSLILNATTGTIRAADADSLTPFASGTAVTITGSISNNATYQVRSHAATNVAGTPLAEGTTATATTISYGSTPTDLTSGADTGALTFAFAPNGNMTITPATANSLANMTAGTTFTINGSTSWDGAFKVVSNTDGVVEIAVDTDQAKSETITQTAASTPLTLTQNGGAAIPLTSGAITMTTSASAATGLTTVTITTAGNDLAFVAGDTISIGGSDAHNGTFTVAAAPAPTASTVSFVINADALRISKFLPQTGRSDVTLTYDTDSSDAVLNTSITATAGSAATGYGTLTFSPSGTTGERITASNGANSFLDGSGNPHPPVGQIFTLSSTSGVNDGVYKVTANNGDYLEVESVQLTTETVTTAEVSASSWYKGDTQQVQHYIDRERAVNVGIYASSPGIEKAIRALGIIAQGAFGTAGGLDQNQNRIDEAMYLLRDALESPQSGTPPYGEEIRGDVMAIQQDVGFVQEVINSKNTKHLAFKGFLSTRIQELEGSDPLEAAVLFNSEYNALQASYQVLAKVQSLSLLNFLR
ncbi:flagellin [Magnetospirillum sp. SS-4]|uniref:flagellin n=1 Tax=Magnetospirillum sp. SS-4 TaxID=2681465 RepID=UPI0013838FCC|nr:flagellin [Magnetospirillum sp. SS-4]CAA7623184.1 conserved hypothetical protein [Magnetospirillum sp. SS-4]